jgi:hypothetical protein
MTLMSVPPSRRDDEGSTKGYKFKRDHEVKEVDAEFVPIRSEIRAEIPRR